MKKNTDKIMAKMLADSKFALTGKDYDILQKVSSVGTPTKFDVWRVATNDEVCDAIDETSKARSCERESAKIADSRELPSMHELGDGTGDPADILADRLSDAIFHYCEKTNSLRRILVTKPKRLASFQPGESDIIWENIRFIANGAVNDAGFYQYSFGPVNGPKSDSIADRLEYQETRLTLGEFFPYKLVYMTPGTETLSPVGTDCYFTGATQYWPKRPAGLFLSGNQLVSGITRYNRGQGLDISDPAKYSESIKNCAEMSLLRSAKNGSRPEVQKFALDLLERLEIPVFQPLEDWEKIIQFDDLV